MAARGAGAAGGQTAEHRILGGCRVRVPGLRRLCSDCVNWAGSRVAPSRWSIAGPREVPHASRDRRRVRPAQGRRHSLDFNRRQQFKQATRSHPHRFCMGADPVRGGVIASFARPGGNVTGLSILSTDIASKRLELLRETVPGIRRLAVMANAGNPQAVLEVERSRRWLARSASKSRRSKSGGSRILLPPSKRSRQAMLFTLRAMCSLTANRTRILTFAHSARLPTMFNNRFLLKRAASCPTARTSRISSGARPSWSTRFCAARSPATFRSSSHQFELVVNLTTAKALGLTIPDSFLAARRRGDRIAGCLAASAHGRLCAGFRLPAMTNLSTRSGGRRPKSAKARNRGQWCSGGAAGAMGIWPRGMA